MYYVHNILAARGEYANFFVGDIKEICKKNAEMARIVY